MAVRLLLCVAVMVHAVDDAADKSFMGRTLALSSGYFDENAALGAPDGDAEGEVDDVGGVTDEDAAGDEVDGVTDGDAKEGEVDDVGGVTDGNAEEGEVDGDSTQTDGDISGSGSGSKIRKLSVNKRRCVPSSDEHCVSYYMWCTRPFYKFQTYAYSKNGVWLELHGQSQLKHWYHSNSLKVFSRSSKDLWLVTVKIPYAKLNLMTSYFLTELKVKVIRAPRRGVITFHPNPKNFDGTFSPMQENKWGDCSKVQMFRAQGHDWAKSICKNVNKGYFGRGTFNLRPHTRTSFSYLLNLAPYSEGGWTCAIGEPTVSNVRQHHCGSSELCHAVHKLTEHSTVACIMWQHCMKNGNNGQDCDGLGLSRQRQLGGRKDPGGAAQHAPKKRRLQMFMLTWGLVEAGEALAALVEENIIFDFEDVSVRTLIDDLGADTVAEDDWGEHFVARGVTNEYGPNGFWEYLSNLQRVPRIFKEGKTIGDAIDHIGKLDGRPLIDALANVIAPDRS